MAPAQVLVYLEGLRSPPKYPYYNINKGVVPKKRHFFWSGCSQCWCFRILPGRFSSFRLVSCSSYSGSRAACRSASLLESTKTAPFELQEATRTRLIQTGTSGSCNLHGADVGMGSQGPPVTTVSWPAPDPAAPALWAGAAGGLAEGGRGRRAGIMRMVPLSMWYSSFCEAGRWGHQSRILARARPCRGRPLGGRGKGGLAV